MYKVYIDGSWRGDFHTTVEAMAYVDREARQWNKSWKILDQWGKIYAQG